MRVTHPPELKAEALAIVAEAGVSEAARRTGLTYGTVASWASRGGVRAPACEQLAKAVETSVLTMAQRRVNLASGLLDDVERLRAQLFQRGKNEALDQQRRMAAIGTAIEKVQLLTGEATGRIETADVGTVRAQALGALDQVAAQRERAKADAA